ncbi:MAG: hypothetical protein K2L21_04120 [Muribaculaceae bacterium]|nr:hypothetical protein [Muribaculaceae bacterium]
MAIDFAPVSMQYMCKPGALPDTDVLVFNLSENEFYPDHSPNGAGWTLALEAVGPLSNTEVNEDPGVPVGTYTVGYGSDATGKYVPFTLRRYSEARLTVISSHGIYTDVYVINAGTMELKEEDGKYYISGQLHGSAGDENDPLELDITIVPTEVDPQYTFFGFPELDHNYTMENPGLVGSYTVRNYRNTYYWGEYNLEFYTTPLDDTMTVAGAGAVMRVMLCTDVLDVVNADDITGEYVVKSYLSNYFSPFEIRSGFLMERDLVFGAVQGSSVVQYDEEGFPIKGSYAVEGTARITHAGEGDNFRIDVAFTNPFGDDIYCNYEGPLLGCVRDAPAFSGIDEVIAVDESPAEYYDITGRRISSAPAAGGFYITRRGNSVSKNIAR